MFTCSNGTDACVSVAYKELKSRHQAELLESQMQQAEERLRRQEEHIAMLEREQINTERKWEQAQLTWEQTQVHQEWSSSGCDHCLMYHACNFHYSRTALVTDTSHKTKTGIYFR